MYAKIFQYREENALTDDRKYPCPSLPVPNPHFGHYTEETVINNREYYHPVKSAPTTPVFVTPAPRPREGNDGGSLLPVLDCRFNLREICKQSILLEDHLSHEKKRCKDCCIKHFLALEGLCEEAVTLDKNGEYTHLRQLPERIRNIQQLWYDNPEQNSHHCSQELRRLRKEFQEDVFPMIFEQGETNSCSSNACRFKK